MTGGEGTDGIGIATTEGDPGRGRGTARIGLAGTALGLAPALGTGVVRGATRPGGATSAAGAAAGAGGSGRGAGRIVVTIARGVVAVEEIPLIRLGMHLPRPAGMTRGKV